MCERMVCRGLYYDGVTQVDQFDPAECTLLVEIHDNIIGFDVYCPALSATVAC